MTIIRYSSFSFVTPWEDCEPETLTMVVVTRLTCDSDGWFYETVTTDDPFVFGVEAPWFDAYPGGDVTDYAEAIAFHERTTEQLRSYYCERIK